MVLGLPLEMSDPTVHEPQLIPGEVFPNILVSISHATSNRVFVVRPLIRPSSLDKPAKQTEHA
jgi:hypothetical protein